VTRIAVVFTGGTISMRHDAAAGGNVPVLSGADILDRTPGLTGLADLVPIDVGLIPASHFTFEGLFEVWETIRAAIRDRADGVVLVQGTDTIEETAFFFDLIHGTDEPIIVTGAMRTSEAHDWDGADNLRWAIRCAMTPALRGEGVLVSLGGTIEPADDVTKTHASALDSFKSLNFGSIGRVADGGAVPIRRRRPRRYVAARTASERVELITATVGNDGRLIDAARDGGAEGLVVAATGAGNTSPGMFVAGIRALEAGLPVALATRSPAGAAGATYAFPGGGATWVRAGAMLTGYLTGPKARVALAVGLGAGLSGRELAALLADPVAAGGG
jgi:L-asparaginase